MADMVNGKYTGRARRSDVVPRGARQSLLCE